MNYIVFEQDWEDIDFDIEDGGRSLAYTMSHSYGDCFVRFQSWDEGKTHKEFEPFKGKRIRITVEVID